MQLRFKGVENRKEKLIRFTFRFVKLHTAAFSFLDPPLLTLKHASEWQNEVSSPQNYEGGTCNIAQGKGKDMFDLGWFYSLKQCQSTQETQNMSEEKEGEKRGELEIVVGNKILNLKESSPQDLVLAKHPL